MRNQNPAGRHILTAQQFDRDRIGGIFKLAHSFSRDITSGQSTLDGLIMASLFYEESTRTRLSCEAAMIRLGGQVIGTENARLSSSVPKGESLRDTVRIVSGLSDVIVLRHEEDDSSDRAAQVSKVPIINGGAGSNQHPTQALLDLYTLEAECGRLDGLTVALVGDLKYGRTVRSLAYLLAKYEGVSIYFVAPPELRIASDIKGYLDRHEVWWREVATIEEVVGVVDAIYMTRTQKDRFKDPLEYERLKRPFCLDRPLAESMKEGSIIMHPLPRNSELPESVDSLPHAAYFRQADNGLFVRMALLYQMFRE